MLAESTLSEHHLSVRDDSERVLFTSPYEDASQIHQSQGRQKALLIGINYFRQRGELNDCVNNAHSISQYLIEHFQYQREDMVILTDNHLSASSQPTKHNILCGMHWLVKNSQPDDKLFFYYSGMILLLLMSYLFFPNFKRTQ